MDCNDLIAQILKKEGVEWLACFPSNPLIEAVAKQGIRPISFRHERGAVMAADGFSRTSDRKRFGVVAIQSQAGAENALGGVAQAYADNIPILILPGGVGLSELAVRPNYSVTNNYQGVVKRVEAIYRPDQVIAVMRRAFSALRNGTPGPVAVELIADVCETTATENISQYIPPRMVKQQPDSSDIKAAVQTLLGARRPMLWAGAGVLFAGAMSELKNLAELTATPVFYYYAGEIRI